MQLCNFTALGVVLAAATVQTAAAQEIVPVAMAAKAFGAREHIIDASISPDGTKVALVVPGPGQSTVVQVADLKTGAAKPVNYADGNPMKLTGCGWVSNTRLLCTLYGISDENYGRLLAYSRMIAMDADGNNMRALAALEKLQEYAAQSDGYVIDWRDGSTNKVLIARRYVPAAAGTEGRLAEGLGVDLMDTTTGKVQHVESPSTAVLSYIADGKGNVRIMGTDDTIRSGSQTRGISTYFYRLAGSKEWKPFATYSRVTDQGMYPVGVDGAANVAYVLQKIDGRDALYRVALDGTMKTELAFAHPEVDISGIVRTGRQGRIVGARYETDKPVVHYFDPQFEQLMQTLHKALPTTPLIRLVDSSADGKTHLVYAGSDTSPGTFYLLDQTTKKMSLVGESRPLAAGLPLGAMTSVTYKAADGTVVPAYLTVPEGAKGKKLPAIVMPHGGPASRDSWGFDWLVQFFVARGYAVLQPNFRGSTGYGDKWFLDNGFKSWKVAIGDVNDGGRWLVSQGIADPAKLAIVGWSYGGYAALQSSILDPNLFKAIVAVAPVSDLGALREEQRGFSNSNLARDYIGDGPHIADGSPARHPEVFKAPVLMFHGDKDINVDIDQARLMDRQLKKAGKRSELVIYPKLDHQLDDSNVRADMLSKADAFLAKALNP